MTAVAAMKAAKATKAMKAKRVSKIAKGKLAKSRVYRGLQEKTQRGQKKTDLMKSKTGKIVTKKAHAAGKKSYALIQDWVLACSLARIMLRVGKKQNKKGFAAVKKGSPLYQKATAYYEAMKKGVVDPTGLVRHPKGFRRWSRLGKGNDRSRAPQ